MWRLEGLLGSVRIDGAHVSMHVPTHAPHMRMPACVHAHACMRGYLGSNHIDGARHAAAIGHCASAGAEEVYALLHRQPEHVPWGVLELFAACTDPDAAKRARLQHEPLIGAVLIARHDYRPGLRGSGGELSPSRPGRRQLAVKLTLEGSRVREPSIPPVELLASQPVDDLQVLVLMLKRLLWRWCLRGRGQAEEGGGP